MNVDLAVAMTRAELRALVLDAAEQGAAKALASFQRGPERMSAGRAAKRARARLADVLQALKDGTLPGRFSPRGHGGRGSYCILSTDVDAWADARR
jgi:hypothetical protein